MTNNIIELSKKLIAKRSIPHDPQELQECLDLALSYLDEYTIEYFEKDGVKSALVYNTPQRPQKFKILFNAHLDVIPGKESQYTPKVVGNRLYGVGALDMKANAACMILVFKELAKKLPYPIALQLVTDEEMGGFAGTKYQVEQGVRADFVIAGETTNFRIVNKTKGILWIKITAKGKTAHGAYPWNGENAVSKMARFIPLLEEHFPNPTEEKWTTTINLSTIQTDNDTVNKIPDICTLSVDIRYIPEDKEIIIQKLKAILPKGFTMKILVKEPAQFVDEKNPYVQLLKEVTENVLNQNVSFHSANGSSDARHLAQVGCDGVEFGSIGQNAGGDDEFIDIASLGKYAEILSSFLLSLK